MCTIPAGSRLSSPLPFFRKTGKAPPFPGALDTRHPSSDTPSNSLISSPFVNQGCVTASHERSKSLTRKFRTFCA